jgi:hypothetical protein
MFKESKPKSLSCNLFYNISVSPGVQSKMDFDAIRIANLHECQLLVYLYETGIADHLAHFWLKIILDGIGSLFSRRDKIESDAFNRLERLLSDAEDLHFEDIPSDVISWDQALEIMPKWKNVSNTYIFHRDDPDVRRRSEPVLLQRVHQEGLCHMLAPVVLHYYLTLKHSPAEEQPAVFNIAKFIRETYRGKTLAEHIAGRGLQSHMFLSNIVGLGQIVTYLDYNQVDSAMLRRHGPVLLSMFTVCDDFGTEGRTIFSLDSCNASAAALDGGPVYIGCDFVEIEGRLFYAKGYQETDRCAGYHSMVIIGVRMEGASRRFLVQNWRRRHQFVEISQEYLETQPMGYPEIYVVEWAPRPVPARFAQPAWRYAESSFLDVPEVQIINK